MPPKYEDLADDYAVSWEDMVISPGKQPALDAIAKKLIASKARYQRVEQQLGVPWFFIAILHNRESGGNFAGVLHNGEHIIGKGRKTRLVPAGRGPFTTWEEAAIDALKLKGLHKIKDWPIERICFEGERFNGWGYRYKGVPSAYLWSFSNQYRSGKYVADHVWSATAVDKQAGIMPVLKRMMALDPSIKIGKPQTAVPPKDPEPPHGVQSSHIMQIQKRLLALGYHEVGSIDGKWGGKTAGAIAAFKNDRHLEGKPVIDEALKAALSKAEAEGWKRPIASDRSEATEETVTKKAPEIVPVKQNRFVAFWGAIVTAILAAVNALGDSFKDVLTHLSDWKDYLTLVPSYVWFGLAAGALLYFYLNAKKGAEGIAGAFRSGERN